MYISGACPYRLKTEENKLTKLFRPWDSASAMQDMSQDSTVSTTTTEDVEKIDNLGKSTKVEIKEGFRPVLAEPKVQPLISPQQPLDVSLDPYSALYPDALQLNLAQSLGLAPGDPLLMESMAQGYALEEYARVLSQEHEAKLLAAKKQRPKKHKCPHCDVGFSNNGQLKGHIRIHTGKYQSTAGITSCEFGKICLMSIRLSINVRCFK